MSFREFDHPYVTVDVMVFSVAYFSLIPEAKALKVESKNILFEYRQGIDGGGI